MKNIAIIGGGVSGLICTKCCLDADLSPVCYEMTDDIGGLWNYDSNAIDGKASVMKSTVINTSKEFMAFSDYPPPSDYPNFMHNTKLLEYFRMYADKNQLRKCVRFRTYVTRIEQADDYEQTGCWMVFSRTQDNDEIGEKYDAVMLATGHHAYPRMIDFAGLDQFKGEKLHSWQYKTPLNFENKTVLVIGVGNSGGDMAVELARIAKQVYLSTRRGTWVFNRVGPNGMPADMAFITEFRSATIKYCPRLTNWLLESEANKKFDHELYRLKPKHRPLEQHPFVNDDMANRIICGSIVIKPNIKQFTSDGYGVIFDDNSKIDHVDCVLMATGFKIAFPYLDKQLIPVDDNRVRLYKYIWPSQLTHPTLAVMGLIQPWGAINPITELQARWAIGVFKNELTLPSPSSMNDEIDGKARQMSQRYVSSPRHTVQVDHVDYCNEIADQVGCRPNILNYLVKDFKLGWMLLFGAFTPYRYRLQGPNSWSNARQTVLTQYQRMNSAFSPNKSNSIDSNYSSIGFLFIFLLILAIIIQYFSSFSFLTYK